MTKKPSAKISTFGSRITSIISVSLVLLIIGILAMTLQASSKLSDNIRRNIGFVVKIDREATDADIFALNKQIAAARYVESFTYLSADSILAYESKLLGENIDSLLNENPFGAEFDIKVRPEYANSDSIGIITSNLLTSSTIEEIVTEASIIDNINHSLNRFTIILIAIACALLIISFVLINNTVSLAIYSRRFIIHTMKLVGATGGFIRRPFLLAGLATGAIAGSISAIILIGTRLYLATIDASIETVLPWENIAITLAAIVATGMLICLIASAIATNRYLRADYDEMFMK